MPFRDESFAEDTGRTMTALAQLPSDMRKVLVLRVVSGLSHKAIAKLMDSSEPAVRLIHIKSLRQFAQACNP
jgi:DNA-directed RNA polymerase specialized sigma24 family protein